MVDASLALGGVVGVVLSAGFLWVEVGRYATPQVPVTVFDERKLLAAYTVGLFVGVPVAAAYLLLVASFANGAFPGALLFLATIVLVTELGQRLLVRSRYWGHVPPVPFYAVAFRAGIGGILALAVVAAYLGSVVVPAPLGLAAALLAALSLVALEVAVALLALPSTRVDLPRTGGIVAGGLFGAVAFFLLGIGPTAGPIGAIAAPLVVLAGAVLTYRGRRSLLAEVPPPTGAAPEEGAGAARAYGRSAPLASGEEPPLRGR